MKNKDDQVLISFGEHVRALRKSQNLSQEELAEMAGLHRTYIGMIERGEKNITLLNISAISNALNISLIRIMEFRNNG